MLFALPRVVAIQGSFQMLYKDGYDAISYPFANERISYKVLSDRHLPSAAELRAESRFIGYIGLNIPRFELPFSPCVEIGWRLDASVWNQGLATEGARAALGPRLAGRTTLLLGPSGMGKSTLIRVIALPVIGANAVVGALMAVRPVDASYADSLKAAAGGAVDVVLFARTADGRAVLTASTTEPWH